MTTQASGYHLSVKTVSRTPRTERLADGSTRTRPGRTAVAAAAYRAAVALRRYIEGRIALTHDFRPKRGVVASYVIAPTGADWALDRETLWNRAEDAERRVNSTTAREYEIAIPADLPEAERRAIVRDFAQSLVDQFGIAADVALHAPSAAGDQRNFHAHVLTTTRVVTADGLGAKTRALDARATGPGLVEEIRARWAALCNRALERAGSAARVDHRSYARRAIARIPTLHNGHRVTALARRLGVATARFTENATIREHNARLDALRSIFRAAAAAPPAPATAPMRLTVPGPRLTRPGPRLTLPPTRMEIKNERPTTTQPGSAHQPLLSVPAQSDRSFQLHGQIRAHSASDSGALPQNSRGNFLVPGRPFRRDARDLPPPSELHRIPGKEGAGGGGRPVERDARSLAGVPNLDGGLTRPSDRIADAIAPGRRFQRESADVLDARVAASVAAKIEEYANWLDRVIAADPAVRVARATGDPAQIDAVEKIVRAEKRQKIPDYASILRNAENVYLEKIRKLLDADADFSTAGDGARPSTKPKFPPFGGIP